MGSYDLLQKGIRKYIYDEGWEALRPIQKKSIEMAQETENNLILAAPTASGKTEAAFLPAINSIEDWNSGVKIIYISPLIALINDQFKRIMDLCKYIDVPVTSWHGEASASRKKKLLKEPKGILLITPESIEAMLSLRSGEAKQLFAGTEWIIVDEMHSFLENNRGMQLRFLMERIKNYMVKEPRLIGMSATLNKEDYGDVKNFFVSKRETNILLDRSKNPLSVSKSYYEQSGSGVSPKAIREIYKLSQIESMLVFPNSKSDVESLAVETTKLGKKQNTNTKYFAHHASVSKEIRLMAEGFAKNSRNALFTIFCTSTLELGIDIGSVDSVVQYNAPYSVSSLGQRLGRSGRSERKNILHFISTDKWSLLQGLAAISLYKEGTIDRYTPIKKPYDVYAHQILSILLEKSGIPLKELTKINRKYICLKDLDDLELRKLLNYMVEKNYIEILENDAIFGTAAEKLLVKAEFFVHFNITESYSIYHDNKKIGTFPYTQSIQPKKMIFLAAKVWEIKRIENRSKKIYVKKALGGIPHSYLGQSGDVTNEIRARMEDILIDKKHWTDIDSKMKEVLLQLSKESLKYKKPHWVYKEDELGIRTFKGTKINKTIQLLLNMVNDGENHLVDKESYIYGDNIKQDWDDLLDSDVSEGEVERYLLRNENLIESFLSQNKYKMLLPTGLKVNYIINNVLDIDGATEYIEMNK